MKGLYQGTFKSKGMHQEMANPGLWEDPLVTTADEGIELQILQILAFSPICPTWMCQESTVHGDPPVDTHFFPFYILSFQMGTFIFLFGQR